MQHFHTLMCKLETEDLVGFLQIYKMDNPSSNCWTYHTKQSQTVVWLSIMLGRCLQLFCLSLCRPIPRNDSNSEESLRCVRTQPSTLEERTGTIVLLPYLHSCTDSWNVDWTESSGGLSNYWIMGGGDRRMGGGRSSGHRLAITGMAAW